MIVGKRFMLSKLTDEQVNKIVLKSNGRQGLRYNVESAVNSHGKEAIWEVIKADKDETSYIKLVGGSYGTWVDNVALVELPQSFYEIAETYSFMGKAYLNRQELKDDLLKHLNSGLIRFDNIDANIKLLESLKKLCN